MTMSYQDQYTTANDKSAFMPRIAAAAFTVSVEQFAKAPLADPVQQKQRMDLAHQIALDVRAFNEIFSWLCVSQTDVNSNSDLTDAKILNTITTLFDAVAQNVIPVPVTP